VQDHSAVIALGIRQCCCCFLKFYVNVYVYFLCVWIWMKCCFWIGVHLGREKGDSVVTVMDIVEVPDLVVNLVEKRVELQPTIDLLSG
jgi:hypothetical protein